MKPNPMDDYFQETSFLAVQQKNESRIHSYNEYFDGWSKLIVVCL